MQSNWRQILSWQSQLEDEMDGIGVKYWENYDYDNQQNDFPYQKVYSKEEAIELMDELIEIWNREQRREFGMVAALVYRDGVLKLVISFFNTTKYISSGIIDAMIMQEG